MNRAVIYRPCGLGIPMILAGTPASALRCCALEANHLTARSPEEYVSTGVTFLVASSDALGPVLRPVADSSNHQAYRKLLADSQQCRPRVEPAPAIQGPTIWICRLQTP
jgi:hypothetical protein